MGELVFGASCSGWLYAFDRGSGEVRWSYDTAGDGASAQFHGDPVVVGDTLVIPSDARPAGLVYAFDVASGEVRWRTPVSPDGITSHLMRSGDIVFGLTPHGRLMAFDLATGAERWSVEPSGQPGTSRLQTHPAVADGHVYYGTYDGKVRAVETVSGAITWEVELGSRLNTSVLVDGDDLLMGAMDKTLYRLTRADGSVAARLALPSLPVGTPTLTDEMLVLVGGQGRLTVVDRQLSDVRWSYVAPSGWSSFQPLVKEGQVVAGTEDGELFAFDLADGSVLAKHRLGGTLRGIGHAEGTYYVGTLQGDLYAFAPPGEGADPLSWLAGAWRGTKGESSIEEIWSEREGDNRIGMFRMVANGTVSFYEFMSIEYDGETAPILRIKHFSKGLRGWEEKDDSEAFELAELQPRRAVFAQDGAEGPKRLIYSLDESGELSIVLEKDRPEDTSRSEFRLRRQ